MPAADPTVRDPCAPGASRRIWLRSGGAVLLAAALPVHALERPAGPVLLTLRGRVRHANDGGQAHFDMAMLQALPQTSFATRTPWYAQPRRFTGPLLRDVLAAGGCHGTVLRMIALNDYRIDVPHDDAQRHDVVVACLLDDKPMGVRDKGPLLLIYPFDDRPELRTALYYSRSAWQLRTIEVV